MEKIRNLLADPERRRKMSENCNRMSQAGVLDRLVKVVIGMARGEEPDCDELSSTGKTDELGQLEEKTDEALIRVASRGGLDPEVVRYLQYRCGAALASAAWTRKNRGIKLAGVLRDRAMIPLLLHVENDPRSAPPLARLLGQKSINNGFIRRNMAEALGKIGDTSDEVIGVLVKKLDDSYWEVRTEAIRALAHLDCRNHEPQLVKRLLGYLDSRNFEEVLAALFYWSKRGETADCRDIIFPLMNHNNVRVRERTLIVLTEKVRARQIPAAELRNDLKEIMVTTTWFTPGFPLKNNLRDLGLAVEEVLRP